MVGGVAAGAVALAGALVLTDIWPKSGKAAGLARVERGRYLVSVIGCDDCHTPWVMTESGPAPDMTRRLSGHPADMVLSTPPSGDDAWNWGGAATNTAYFGPWGVSYTMNLTPDENTGIGIWTEEIFLEAIRSGRHWGVSRPILPPMPWPSYAQMTDEDLRSVFAYLRTIPPVHNRVPEPLIAEEAPPS